MTVVRVLSLRAGERVDLVQETAAANELHCVSGSIRIAMRGSAFGLSMQAGERYLLRSRKHYRVTARKKAQLAIHQRG